MEITFGSRLKHAWNAFVKNKDPTVYMDTGPGYYHRPDRPRLSRGNERTIVTAVYNRIAMDVALIDIRHVRLDGNERYIETINSDLNSCFSLSANIDQTGRSFIQDAVMSMFDEGCVALVPVDTTFNPETTGAYDIQTMRTGRITEWYPQHVRVNVYNEKTGLKEDVLLPKSVVAIVENPLYAVMNEPNSTMQRLIRKLRLMDTIDEMNGSGKLDLIIQLPYVVKSEARKQQAELRRTEIERQLAGSKYGIAYTDGTEKITQLNRAVENTLMSQVEFLTSMLYSQLGITKEIMDGTADEKAMLNYYNRTIQPILVAITEEIKRKFLTKTARTQGQSIEFFRDPFSLVPIADLTEMADKMTRNEIMTANEIRQVIGMKPSDEPKADKLQNSNLYQENPPEDEEGLDIEGMEEDEDMLSDEDTELLTTAYGALSEDETNAALGDLDDLDSQLDELEELLAGDLKHYASPYYDPVKAHEYYEEHKKLKGRRSTAGLNAEGKNAARYIKEQLNNERKAKVEAHKQKTNDSIDSSKAYKKARSDAQREKTKAEIDRLREQKKQKVEQHKTQTQNRIDQIREFLKNLDPIEKDRQRERLQGQIDELRAANKAERTRLNDDFKASSTALREAQKRNIQGFADEHKRFTTNARNTHKEVKSRLKQEYDAKYEAELDKLRSEASFQKQTKKKK